MKRRIAAEAKGLPATRRGRLVPVGSLLAASAAALLVLATSTAVAAAAPRPGTLDSSFGTGGKVLTAFSGVDRGNDVAVQADGKIVVVGQAGRTRDFAVARYKSNGILDSTFGAGGKVTTHFPGCAAAAHAVAVQPDGKIVAAGKARGNGAITSPCGDWVLARYLANGALDPGFGTGGKVVMNFRPDADTGDGKSIADVAIQADGKIVAVGTTFAPSNLPDADFALTRHLGDGTLDPTFGTGGKVVTDFRPEGLGDYEIAEGVAVQADGKIVAAGWFSMGGDYAFALARYSITGAPDPTFGTAGLVRTDVGFDSSYAQSVAIQADGKIVAAGGWYNSQGAGTGGLALARYDANGIRDPAFGSAGKVISTLFPVFGDGLAGANDLALQPGDGKLVLVGENVPQGFALARYLANGTLDPGFGKGGSVSNDLGGSDSANAVAVQADGKIVAAGKADPSGDGGPNFAVARYYG